MSSQPLVLSGELSPRRLGRRGLQVALLIGVIVLIAMLAPGLGEVRDDLADAAPGWLALAVALEAASCASYVLLFRQAFCPSMSWRTSWELGLSQTAVGSIVPASGAGGVALGAWVLHKDGMPADHVVRRSVAFLLIKSSVNFFAVAVLGLLLFIGLGSEDLSPALTILPAVMAAASIALVAVIARSGGGRPPQAGRRIARLFSTVRAAIVEGSADALVLVRRAEPALMVGAFGYWAFDNLVLWAAFESVGSAPGLEIILMGYLIGQLGGALPIPGGIGGMDAGLLGGLMLYGAPVAAAAAAVLIYRLILFWIPLIIGGAAFVGLRRNLNRPDRPDLCPRKA